MSSVIITGATGFIGSHITRCFLENGIKVCCLVRKNSSLKNLEGLDVEIRYGDIKNVTELEKAFSGFDFVIHNSGRACDWGSYDEFYRTNVDGTVNVLKACVNTRIKDVIMTGTISVYGEEDCNSIKDESCIYNSHYKYFLDKIFPCGMNYYRDSKAEAKKHAVRFANDNVLNLTIIEPVWVYGEREFNTGFYEYMKSAKDGIPFTPGCKSNKYHVVYAGDLAYGYYLAYKKRLKGINPIIVGDEAAYNMDHIYKVFCREAAIKKPVNIPKALIYPVAFLMELIYTLARAKKPPVLTRGRVNMFYDNIEYSTKKARKLLDFSPKHTLEEGIRKTVAWYKENKYL